MLKDHQTELVSEIRGLKDLFKRRWPGRGLRVNACRGLKATSTVNRR